MDFFNPPSLKFSENPHDLVQAFSSNMESDHHEFEDIDVILAEESSQFYADPYGWVMWAFDWGNGELEGFDGPDVWQRDFLIGLGKDVEERGFDGVNAVDPIRKVRASGHGIGKSCLLALVILWINSTRPHCRGVVTANTGDQLRTKTWPELAKWKSRCITGHWFELTMGKGSMSLYHVGWPETWRVDAQTCREENSESFAGLHAVSSTPYYIFDEASAIPDKIWEVAEGGLTDGEPIMIVFGNPTQNTGYFRKCFNRRDIWDCAQIDSRTARMTNKRLIEQWLHTWGEDSDFFRVRVRGEFPRAGDDQFIPSDIVFDARRNSPRYLGDDPLVCGVDVARGGSDSCMIQFRRGKDARSETVYKIPGEKVRDSMYLVSKLLLIFDRHKPDFIFVDATGIGGPVGDRLRQLGYRAFDVHFGGKADDPSKYANKTAEMGYRLRQWLFDGGSIVDDPLLEQELTDRLYEHNNKDQLVVEKKDDVKARLGHSPDWADALYLTFAHAVPKLKVSRREKDLVPGQRDSVKTRDYDPLQGM